MIKKKMRQIFLGENKLSKFIKKGYYKIIWGEKEKKFIIISTIRKCGTNWLRIFLINYINIYYQKGTTKITYNEMNKIIPNDYHEYQSLKKKYLSPSKIMSKTPYKDIVYGHQQQLVEFCEGKIILLYRNPFDWLISFFYYKFKNRGITQYKHPREIINFALKPYAKQYNKMKQISQKDNALMISYESMKKTPKKTFKKLINWLNLPYDESTLNKAIKFSSISTVRNEEKSNKKAIHSPKNYKGFFTRSGKIGQWKKYFNNKDLSTIKDILKKENININEFIIK